MPADLPPDSEVAESAPLPTRPDWPRASTAVRAALQAALADGSWGRYDGGHVAALAQRMAQLHQVTTALCCCSGTFAVEWALRALLVKPGDEVILAGYDFPGNFRAIEAVGARPVLVDIDPQTWSMDAAQLEAAIGPQTVAIIVSHLHGGLADMQAISEIAARHGLWVVEDACQAPLAQVQGRAAGAWGDVGAHSFGGSKLLTAGRGGAILTNNAQFAQRAIVYAERGNHAFALSEMQAAALLPQWDELPAQHATRRARVAQLLDATRDIQALSPVRVDAARGQPAYYKLAWLYLQERDGRGRSRDEIIAACQRAGLAIDAGFRGFVGRSTARCRRVGDLPHSTAAAGQTLILHHPVLLEPSAAIDAVAARLHAIFA